MSVQTTANQASESKTYYDRVLLEAARPTLLMQRWARKRNIPKGEGQTIQFRRFELLNAKDTDLVEGVTPPGDDPTITSVTCTPTQRGGYVTISDYLSWTAMDPVLNEWVDTLGTQAGETFDNMTRDVMVAGSTVRYAAGRASRVTVTSADLINGTELRKVRRTLRNNKAKPVEDGYFVAIVHPYTVYDLQSMPEWQAMGENSRPDELKQGLVKEMWGFRFYETEKAKVFTAAGASSIDVYASVFMGRDFYGTSSIEGHALETIMKPLGSGGTEDPLNQRQTVGWKGTLAACRLNENYAVRLEHAVSG